MIDNSTLKAKLENELAKQNLSEEEKERLVSELNFLANLLIDRFIVTKSDEERKY